MDNTQQGTQQMFEKAAEACEMGFWDYAAQDLLRHGWGVNVRPVQVRNSEVLGKYVADVTNYAVPGMDAVEDHVFGSGYGATVEMAVHAAIRDLQKAMADRV